MAREFGRRKWCGNHEATLGKGGLMSLCYRARRWSDCAKPGRRVTEAVVARGDGFLIIPTGFVFGSDLVGSAVEKHQGGLSWSLFLKTRRDSVEIMCDSLIFMCNCLLVFIHSSKFLFIEV